MNQIAIPDATDECTPDGANGWLAEWTVNNAQCTDAGEYSVVFYNKYGAVLSGSARLTIAGINPLTITATVGGNPATIPVAVEDPAQAIELTANVCFERTCVQWYKDDVAIPNPNQNPRVYRIEPLIGCDDLGIYKVVVFDQAGNQYEASAAIIAGSASLRIDSVKLAANAGAGATYDWYFHATSPTGPWGSPIAIGPEYTLQYSSPPQNRDGYYRVVAHISGQPDKTARVQVYWNFGSTDPVYTTVVEDANQMLSATYASKWTGVGPSRYEWWYNGMTLVGTEAQYTIANMVSAPTGWYLLKGFPCDGSLALEANVYLGP